MMRARLVPHLYPRSLPNRIETQFLIERKKRSKIFIISIRFRMDRGYKYEQRFHASSSFRSLYPGNNNTSLILKLNPTWLEVRRKRVPERQAHRNEPVRRRVEREAKGRMLENDDEQEGKPTGDISIECSSKFIPMLEFPPKR